MSVLPDGTVSLLFSDVEGSTRLLRRFGQEYAAALDAHRRILREAWAGHGGAELGTEGDSFYVAFARASDAVEAAVAAQRGLAVQGWPHGESVRVRIGIHTGAPLRHGDAYVGMDVHRAARIAAAAHGGQILLSEATAGLLEAGMVTLRDLGRHTMKDLAHPEHLYQVVADGLETRFPPVRSLGSTSNLPRPLTPLVGRSDVLARLVELATRPDTRLLTLTGPGGSGKTRLAIALAEMTAEQHPDGVYFAALETVRTEEVMWTTVAAALDLPPEGRAPPALYDHIAHRAALLVLDNLEQVQGADVVVAEMMRVAPSLRLVATSRHPVHVAGEHEFPVPPLDVPATGDLTAVRRSGAVELFVAQARMVRPDFALDESNAATVRAIVEALDGLPLALELVAARVKMLSLKAMQGRLDKVLDVATRDRTRATRQHTLRQATRWSYDLLEVRQRRLLRLLGVFSRGAGISAVQAVGAAVGLDPDDVLDDLESLVDASLVTVSDGPDGEPRIRLLNTIRAFAASELSAAGEQEAVGAAAAAHFADWLRDLEQQWLSAGQLSRWQALETDLDNLRRALEWYLDPAHAVDESDRFAKVERARVLAAGLTMQLLADRGHLDEAREWCELALTAVTDTTTPAAVTCQLGLVAVLLYRNEFERATEVLDAAMPVLRAAEPTQLLPPSLLALYRAWALNRSAWIALTRDEPERAQGLGDEAMALPEEPAVVRVLAALTLSDIDEYRGDLASALRRRQTLAPALAATGNDLWIVMNEVEIAATLRRVGRPAEARAVLQDVANRIVASRSPGAVLDFADIYAAVLLDLGDLSAAARLLGAGNAMRARLETPRSPFLNDFLAPAVESGRAQLKGEWTTLEAAGGSDTVERVLAGLIDTDIDTDTDTTAER